MKRTQKQVIVARLARALEERGSWVGETHLQKACFLLQVLTGVPLEYSFTLYMHGPFSFDLRDELNRMRADGLLKLIKRPSPYGPTYRVTAQGKAIESRFPKTLGAVTDQIDFVSAAIGSRGAANLERLGTALLLLRQRPDRETSKLAKRFHDLKPHVSVDSAIESLSEVKGLLKKAPKMTQGALV